MKSVMKLYKDINLSKYTGAARAVNLFTAFSQACKRDRGIAALFFLGCIALLSAVAKLFLHYSGAGSAAYIVILLLEAVFAGIIFLSLYIAKRISYVFNCGLYIGARDSWFLLAGMNGMWICHLLWPEWGPVGSFAASVLLSFGLCLTFGAYYYFRIAVKKQPDLEMPVELKADDVADNIKIDRKEINKIQIKGDTRDAVILSAGEEARIFLPESPRKIKFSYAMYNKGEKLISSDHKVQVIEKREEKEKIIFSKNMNPLKDEKALEWNDAAVNVNGGSVVFRVKPGKKTNARNDHNKYCFSVPRISAARDPKKIILIVMDAVRSDHLGCYGYKRNTSENVDKLSEEAVRYKYAFSQGDWTLPSFMSMMTGMYPSSHKVYHSKHYHTPDENIPTLPEVLKKNGFITRCFLTHKRLVSTFGFARGFDSHLFRQCDKKWGTADADDVTDKALDILDFHRDDNLFLMLHYFDTHQPCDPPSPYSDKYDKTYSKPIIRDTRAELMNDPGMKYDDRDLENLIARYDAEISHVDMKIGVIVDYLKRTGQFDESMIVLTADHGMLLNDHGSMTKFSLFDETVKVPLIIKYPDSRHINAKVEEDIMAQAGIDLMPTILKAHDIECPANVEGRALGEIADDGSGPGISESLYMDTYMLSLRSKDRRYIFSTRFDTIDIKNFARNDVSEDIYTAYDGSAEKGADKDIVSGEGEKLKELAAEHISKIEGEKSE